MYSDYDYQRVLCQGKKHFSFQTNRIIDHHVVIQVFIVERNQKRQKKEENERKRKEKTNKH